MANNKLLKLEEKLDLKDYAEFLNNLKTLPDDLRGNLPTIEEIEAGLEYE